MSPVSRVLPKLEGVAETRNGWTAKCPAHDDHHPSLSIAEGDDGRVLLKCFAGCSTEDVCSALGLESSELFPGSSHGEGRQRDRRSQQTSPGPTFTPSLAARVWSAARARARDDDAVEDDRDVYSYLYSRGLAESSEESGFGILTKGMDLPGAVDWWAGQDYRLVAALYDLSGSVVNVQSRSIVPSNERKVLFPPGSKARGTAFVNRFGLELLQGTWPGFRTVILAEGLTDHLALGIVAQVPVLTAPGTSMVASAAGPWARGFEVFIATDGDDAGDRCVEAAAAALFENGAECVYRLNWPNGCFDACDAIAELGTVGLADWLEETLQIQGGSQ